MMRNHWHAILVAATLVPALAGGCLRRKETITIDADGKVTMRLEFEGEAKDFNTADALPTSKGGWRVQREKSVKDDGKETVQLSAEREVAPGEPLPSTLAAGDDRDADLYLAFPTTLRRETRDDGIYLHFHRAYQPRAWNHIQFWQDQGFDDSTKKLLEKPFAELTPDERRHIVQTTIGVEAYKQLELFREALRESQPDLAQDAWLAARTALLQLVENRDWDALLERIAPLAEDERNAAFEKESQRIVEEMRATFRTALQLKAKFSDEASARLDAAFVRAKKRYDITSELGGHGFEVAVKMPGEVVAHNGDKVGDDGSVTWEFEGSAFRDRTHELMVTTRLPKERDAR